MKTTKNLLPPELLTSSYDYHLPPEQIATHPASPRDHARLLVVDQNRTDIIHDHFYNLESYLPTDTHLVFNNTRVIKARLFGQKGTGGKIELLYLHTLPNQRHAVKIRGKITVDSQLIFDDNLQAKVQELLPDGSRIVQFFHDSKPLDFNTLLPFLDSLGHIPLPPYIKRDDTAADTHDYQSVFADIPGAVAAPTASLHFTPELFSSVTARHPHHFLTLHVGAGTFVPVEAPIITDHPMHAENYVIPQTTGAVINNSTPLLAVGTTACRTVEHFARTREPTGSSRLFLHPHHPPIRINHLLTNFHLPQSTLLMLVASFLGLKRTMEVYEEAIRQRYRFYSYGDAMLIL